MTQILDSLDPDQRDVALALRGPVCVLAGAGTGKTRAITHRIAYGVSTGQYKADGVLAVTFTARAAGEMRTRLRDLGVSGVQARTFHSAALRQLRYFWPRVIGGSVPRLVEHKAQIVADACRRLGFSIDKTAVRDLSSEIEWAKVSRVMADEYPVAAAGVDRPPPAGYDRADIARLIACYEDAKDERGVIDMEDVLWLLAGMLVEHHGVAEQIRSQYRWFTVDEYQDISSLQHFLLEQWLGGREELCVVGDPAQTIYSFAGASPSYLLGFAAEHPRSQVIRLTRDYRSTPQVVSLANDVMAARGRLAAAQTVGALVSQRDAGPEVVLRTYDDDEAEAAGVAARATALIAAGVPAAQIAVLYRTNAQSEVFERAMSEAGVGIQLLGGDRFFSRPDVREAIVRVRGSGIGADLGQSVPELVRDILRTMGWSEQAPEARGAARERWQALNALVALADDREAAAAAVGEPGTVAGFIAELDERAAAQHAPTVDGVTLSTLHAAKGLEWEAVFLVGMSDGLLPWVSGDRPADLAEERRLLYVGVTRARTHLELSWARSRTPGSRAVRQRSRFLAGLWPDDQSGAGQRRGQRVGQPGIGGGAVRQSGALDGSRTGGVLGAGAGARGEGERSEGASGAEVGDDPVLAALLSWRDAQATAAGVRVGVVLPDVVLRAVAAARPQTPEELAAVPGLGQTRLARYGIEIINLTRSR